MKTEGARRLKLEVQCAVEAIGLPSRQQLRSWVRAALQDGEGQPLGLVIRLVGEAESRELNGRFRGKDRATNVLSFPFEAPPGVESDHLGDLVICAPVVKREALEQRKAVTDHWAHMVVHGVLHLRGYDHQSEPEARRMESLETRILGQMGIADPYGMAI
ncbi:MAG: rRNA maturation RNase YbeY [Gammaproteobacteria bacterium]|jgi:probable rRNA maturation factor